MAYNPTPPAFTSAALAALKTKILEVINDINAMNDLDIALTTAERQSGVTVGPKRKVFNDYYFGNIDNNAQFKPTMTTIPHADAVLHFGIGNSIIEIQGLVGTISEKLQDVQLNSEHFSFENASQGRKYANEAAEIGKPGADAWSGELNARFPDTTPGGGGEEGTT